MKTYSLRRRLIVTVLLVEVVLALCVTALALIYVRHQQLRTFDVMLRGRADSLLGAVQDAENAADTVMLAPKDLDLRPHDLYEVRNPEGRVVGQSPLWSSRFEGEFHQGEHGRNFRALGRHYRGVVLHGVRQVDADDGGPGIARPVIIDYAAPLRPVWHAISDAAKFLLLWNFLVLVLTGLAIYFFLRRGMAPLELLAARAADVSPASWEFSSPPEALEVEELAALSRTLASTVRRLGDTFAQQRRFLHDAAHELKTSVTIIKSSLQLLDSRPRNPEEYRAGLAACLDDCARLEELVSNLLTLARLEQAAGDSAAPGSTDLGETLREAAAQLGPLAELHGVVVRFELEEGVFAVLSREACGTLAQNLILNALQHTPHGGCVTLRTSNAGGKAQFSVEDTGEGIAAEDLPFIFDRFYRGDRSRSRSTGGTGLGLAICKATVDAYHGTIEIESEPGHGTRARVTLPAVPARLQLVFSKQD